MPPKKAAKKAANKKANKKSPVVKKATAVKKKPAKSRTRRTHTPATKRNTPEKPAELSPTPPDTPATPYTVRTPEKRAAFLTALGLTGNVAESCRLADVARNSMYLWRQDDPQFAIEWQAMLVAGAEQLEDEARRRAMEGWDEPKFSQGAVCGTVRKYSDTLLIFLLKGAMPDKYGDKVEHKHGNKEGETLKIEFSSLIGA